MSDSINLVRSANFGSSKGSLATVGYRILDTNGTLSGSRITSGIGEIIGGSGIYSASMHFTSEFSGSVLWDTGESSPSYASEDYNGNDYKIDFTRHVTTGRWTINKSTSEMVFYKEDNHTEIARYELFDENGNPSVSSVFDRKKKTS
jgi:hypothetical protein